MPSLALHQGGDVLILPVEPPAQIDGVPAQPAFHDAALGAEAIKRRPQPLRAELLNIDGVSSEPGSGQDFAGLRLVADGQGWPSRDDAEDGCVKPGRDQEIGGGT